MKDRKDIDKKYTWNLDKIYSSIDDFNKDYKLAVGKIEEISKYENNLTDSSKNMYNGIKLYFDTARIMEKLYMYAHLSFDLDTSNNKKQELTVKISNLYDMFSKNSYYFHTSIRKLDKDELDRYYKEEQKLHEYENYIKDIYRYKEHILSDEEERLLSSIGKIVGNSYDTYELFKDSDMSFDSIKNEDGKEAELTDSTYSVYMESKDRRVRKDAFETLYKEYKKYKNTFASLISTNMKESSVLSKVSKFNSSIERSLFEDEVDIEVYNNLIDSVHSNISYLHDYYSLKKKLLGLDELHIYDVYVPIIDSYSKKYDYETAKEMILKVLNVFGDEYINKVKEYLDSRIIDVYPSKGKRTGGYSSGGYDTDPYILLNYQDKYNDMSTLIHEMGHSMHSYYSRKYNTYQESDYRIFVAEVASTVNELLLSHYMIKHSDSNEEKLFILNNLMELYRATIYRQTMFAEFEKEISNLSDKGEALTADKLCDMYYDLNKFYFGDEVSVDDEIRYEWERIPHFYYDFYVYKYSTGLSASTMIVKNILDKKENAVDNYIEFLKCGGRLSPLESLKVAGVDLTKKEVVDEALEEFKNIMNMYEEVLEGDK